MTSVCKWLGFYLCMKEPSGTLMEKHHLNALQGSQYKCDMLITLKESKESSGGLAFDVILKPPVMDNPPIVFMKSHSPTREISQEDINKKLKEAEERRLALESQKLLSVQKSKERAAEANQRVQDLNESFIKEVEKKLNEKMEVSAEMKTQQIRLLQEKLKEHAQRVEVIRKFGEQSREELKERIEKKLETAWEKRENQLARVQERIRQHQKHIEEVIECSNKFSRDTEERIILKMENSLKNREEHLNSLMDRLKKHEQHIRDIRQNKMNQSSSSDDSSPILDGMDFRSLSQYSFNIKSEMSEELRPCFDDLKKEAEEDAKCDENKNENLDIPEKDVECIKANEEIITCRSGDDDKFDDIDIDFEKEIKLSDDSNEINAEIIKDIEQINKISDVPEKDDINIVREGIVSTNFITFDNAKLLHSLGAEDKILLGHDNDDSSDEEEDYDDEDEDDNDDNDGDESFPPPPPLSATLNETLLPLQN